MVAKTTFRIENWPQTIPEFNRLVEATQDELVHFASYRLGNRQDAEDVVQDIYVEAFRDREKRRDITDVRPYLFRMTGNRCTDFLRVRSRRPKEEAMDAAGSDNLFDSLAEAQRIARLRSLLDRIPAREAEVIRLRAWSELTFAEVAIAVKSSVPTVKSRFHYGVEKLRKLLR
jgi:RNA polymerase sigma-70 factor (ECF subfamily)